jgi:hypothetical protein
MLHQKQQHILPISIPSNQKDRKTIPDKESRMAYYHAKYQKKRHSHKERPKNSPKEINSPYSSPIPFLMESPVYSPKENPRGSSQDNVQSPVQSPVPLPKESVLEMPDLTNVTIDTVYDTFLNKSSVVESEWWNEIVPESLASKELDPVYHGVKRTEAIKECRKYAIQLFDNLAMYLLIPFTIHDQVAKGQVIADLSQVSQIFGNLCHTIMTSMTQLQKVQFDLPRECLKEAYQHIDLYQSLFTVLMIQSVPSQNLNFVRKPMVARILQYVLDGGFNLFREDINTDGKALLKDIHSFLISYTEYDFFSC